MLRAPGIPASSNLKVVPETDEAPRPGAPLGALLLTLFLLLPGCDEEETSDSGTLGTFQPSQSDFLQGRIIARQADSDATIQQGNSSTPGRGFGDLSMLGGHADQNQQAFRQRFGLSDPTQEQRGVG